MNISFSLLLLVLLFAFSYYLVNRRFYNLKYLARQEIASIPHYYANCVMVWMFMATIFILISYYAFNNILIFEFVKPHIFEIIMLVNLAIVFISLSVVKGEFKARQHFEKFFKILFVCSSFFTISVTILILLSILFQSIKFFQYVDLFDFLFGLKWDPQSTLIEGKYKFYGVIPVLTGTLLITSIAIILAVPLGILSAIYLTEYASPKFRNFIKPFLEMLAGIPTVIYGYFAALIVGPLIRDYGEILGLNVASESALAAGIVMGIMIIPFILSMSDDVLSAVPKNLRDAALALGSTKSETALKVLVPAALPGIMGSVLLAISRAIGETMIVTMAAGITANLTANPLSSVTTFTVQIMNLLMGDQEFDSPKTLSAFALGLTLFIMTLILNLIALMIVRKYREKYD